MTATASGSVELHIMVEPQQGATYEQLRALAVHAESCGFVGFFSSDHYLMMGGTDPGPGPLDTWTTLAGLARDTKRLRLGSLITPVTFRRPGPLAITVAQVDAMSGGRVDFSLGAGWFPIEHWAYGIPFPPMGERFDMLEEQLEVIVGLWGTPDGDQFSFSGKYYTVENSPALPKPVQRPHPPIIIGGQGPKRTPKIAAKWADEFNLPFVPLETFVAQGSRVRSACELINRHPSTLRFSAALALCCGSTEDEFISRANTIGREPEEIRTNGAAGLPHETIDKIKTYVAAGAQRIYLQVLDITDLDHLTLVANEVMPGL